MRREGGDDEEEEEEEGEEGGGGKSDGRGELGGDLGLGMAQSGEGGAGRERPGRTGKPKPAGQRQQGDEGWQGMRAAPQQDRTGQDRARRQGSTGAVTTPTPRRARWWRGAAADGCKSEQASEWVGVDEERQRRVGGRVGVCVCVLCALEAPPSCTAV